MWVPRWRGNQQIPQSRDHSISRSLNSGQFFDQVAHLRLQARFLDRRRKTDAAYAAKAFADARNDLVVAPNGGESVHDLIRYRCGHLPPRESLLSRSPSSPQPCASRTPKYDGVEP